MADAVVLHITIFLAVHNGSVLHYTLPLCNIMYIARKIALDADTRSK